MLKQPLTAESEPEPYRFTVEEWHRLGEAGIFHEDDRVELLDGEIIIMSPIGSRHALTLNFLNEALVEQGRRRFTVAPGNPLEADDRSEPLPDLALVPRTDRTAKRHPLSRDAYLIVEIADSSLTHDRTRKLVKYATTGVREYWIVNLKDDDIEVHREPVGDHYTQVTHHAPGETISPLAFPDVLIPVAEIIPAP